MKRHPLRFPVDVPARFRAADSEGGWETGKLINLSEGGLCLEAESPLLVPGEMLELVIDSVDKKGVPRQRLIRAQVVWRKVGRAGLLFTRSRLIPRNRPRSAPVVTEPPRPRLVTKGKPSSSGKKD